MKRDVINYSLWYSEAQMGNRYMYTDGPDLCCCIFGRRLFQTDHVFRHGDHYCSTAYYQGLLRVLCLKFLLNHFVLVFDCCIRAT